MSVDVKGQKHQKTTEIKVYDDGKAVATDGRRLYLNTLQDIAIQGGCPRVYIPSGTLSWKF